jgi:hypothetical protein
VFDRPKINKREKKDEGNYKVIDKAKEAVQSKGENRKSTRRPRRKEKINKECQ